MRKQETNYPKLSEKENGWVILDATDQVLGRLATHAASIIKGKDSAKYTPSVDMGRSVIILNAEKVKVTGQKMLQKKYYRHSGFPGGIKSQTYRELFEKDPCEVIRKAVWGMLPHNRLGRRMIVKLKVYKTNEHPHEAQNPIVVDAKVK